MNKFNDFMCDLYANSKIGLENIYNNIIVPNTKKYIRMELAAIILELYVGSVAIETEGKKVVFDLKNENIRFESSYKLPQKLKEDTLNSITDTVK